MRVRKKAMAFLLMAGLVCGFMGGCVGSQKIKSSIGALDNGTITDSSVVVNIGKEGVRYSEILGYCYLLKKQYEDSFGQQLWDYSIADDKTIGDEAKEEILNMVTELKVISSRAKAEKVSLTADEKDEAIQQAEKILRAATKKEKEKYSLTTQSLLEIFESNFLANKMFYIATDDADTEVTDEEARQADIQYLFLRTSGENADGTAMTLGQDEAKAVFKRAKKLLEEAEETEDFQTFAMKNTEVDRTELILDRESTALPSEVVSEAMELKTGEVSGLIEAEDGYYILYCVNEQDEDATYQKKEDIIARRQEEMFKEKYADWLGNSEISISKSFWKIFHI